MTRAIPDLAMWLARQVARITDQSIQSIRRQQAIRGRPDGQLNAFMDVRCRSKGNDFRRRALPSEGNAERRISAGLFNRKE